MGISETNPRDHVKAISNIKEPIFYSHVISSTNVSPDVSYVVMEVEQVPSDDGKESKKEDMPMPKTVVGPYRPPIPFLAGWWKQEC